MAPTLKLAGPSASSGSAPCNESRAFASPLYLASLIGWSDRGLPVVRRTDGSLCVCDASLLGAAELEAARSEGRWFVVGSGAQCAPLPHDGGSHAAGGAGRHVILGVLQEGPGGPASQPRDQAIGMRVTNLRIEAEESVELRCGQAKLALAADGTVTINGQQIVSRAQGRNYLQGGMVLIN